MRFVSVDAVPSSILDRASRGECLFRVWMCFCMCMCVLDDIFDTEETLVGSYESENVIY